MAKIVDPTAGYMPLPLKFKRSNAGPLDTTSLWTNEANMKTYAKSGSTSYVGQVLTLVDNNGVKAYVIKDVGGTVEKLPMESEISGSIGPITGDVSTLKTSVSSISSSVKTLSGSVTSLSGAVGTISGYSKNADDALATRISNLDTTLRTAITSASTSAHDTAVVDAGTNMQSYLTNTYTPFVEGLDSAVLESAKSAAASGDSGIRTLISNESTRASAEEAKKIDKNSIATSLTQSSTDDTVPGAKTTYEFVNSSIANMAAFYLYKNAAGDSFATKAELNAAISSGTFYNAGVKVTPKKNDYTIVQSDESHSSGSKPTTRYVFDGSKWVFQYIVNNTTFNEAQLAAINSTITETKLGEITGSIQTLGTNVTGITSDVSELSSTVGTLASNVVKTSGNQSISGTKTFSNSIVAGRVEITGTVDVSSGSGDDSAPFVIGPKAGQHIAIDGNEIMSKATSSTVGQLYLNNEGGLVNVGVNGTDNGSTGLKTKALWLGNVASGLLLADTNGKVYKQTASAGLVYDNKGTISYKGIGTTSGDVAAGNHTHSQYATTSTTSTLSGYITSLSTNTVKTSGNQTISGIKTFSTSISSVRLELPSGDISSLASDDSAPIIIGPKAGQHLAMDGNEIMSKATSSTVGQLHINYNGGLVNVGMGGTDNGSTGLKTKALWLGNVTSGLLMADSAGKVYKQTSSTGLVYDDKGTISYKAIGSSAGQVAAGNHTHSNYATTSTTSTLSGYITSLQQQINALSGIYLNRFFAAD